MAQIKHILIICGEPSGDLNAASLARAILQLAPETKISAVGGELLAQTGAQIYRDIKDLAVLGFFDVLRKLPRFFSLQKLILEKIKEEKPDAIILVDFSGFNLRLAKKIRKSIPTIYYTSPQVWASREGRLKTIKEHIHKMLVFFKFEQEFYKRYGIDADFIGHPLLDIVRPTMEKKEFFNKFRLSASKTTIALLPGSRKQEIENILPVMLKASSLISKQIKDVQFVIAKSPQLDWSIYLRKMHNLDINSEIIEGKTCDCLEFSDFALVASGTATLEAAIIQRPFVVIYKMNPLNYLLYRPQVKLKVIGMVNIVAGKIIVPEFIQFRARPKEISEYVLKTLQNPSEIQRIKNDLSKVRSSLGEKGASMRAAEIIIGFLTKK